MSTHNTASMGHFDLNKIFASALQHGGEFAEIFHESSESNRLFYEDKKIDRVVSGIDSGIGLRVIYGTQSVSGYTTDLTEKSLKELAETLSKVVQGKISNQTIVFKNSKSSFKQAIAKPPKNSSLKAKLQYLQRADATAWAASRDVKQVTVGYVETLRKIEIVNSLGQVARDEKQYLTMYTQLVGARDGQTQTAYEAQGGFVGLELFDEHSPESIAKEAARRLDALLSSKPAPAGTMPIVLAAEAGGTMVHEAVGHGLEADLACNGLSVYKDKIGQQVASPLVSIIDDGTLPGKRGSYAFDDEGESSKKNVLIENGILKAYMSDRMSHVKFGVPLTGNGRRESYRHKPIVRMTNTYLASGKDEPESILANTPMGIYVKGLGGGQVNTVTGDFVFAITEGYLIYDGEIGPAVRGATLAGNGPDVLKKVDRIGTDLGFAIGTCGKDGQGAPVTDAQPTIRIPEIVVGGEVPISTYWKK